MLQTLQQEFGPCAIVEVRWLHLVLQEIALRINEQMTLAALHLLGAVIAARPSHLSRLDRLTVDDRRARLRSPANRAAITLAQDAHDLLPRAVLAPLSIMVEDGVARGYSCGSIRHWARPEQIEDRLDDAP